MNSLEASASILLNYAKKHQSEFEASKVSYEEAGRVNLSVRISMSLGPMPELKSFIIARIEPLLPDIIKTIGCANFQPTDFEIELVAHGHGSFFSRHVDTILASEKTTAKSRVISMVYYFNKSPRTFSGGQLRLHALAASGEPGTYVDIEPLCDSAVFFPSWFPHEVLPITCPSKELMDSRFAINCWVYK
jgi:SM-20-related protein